MPRAPREKPKAEKAIIVRIPESWHEWLREQTYRTRVPAAEIVRRALESTYKDLPPRPVDDEDGSKGGEYAPFQSRSLVIAERPR